MTLVDERRPTRAATGPQTATRSTLTVDRRAAWTAGTAAAAALATVAGAAVWGGAAAAPVVSDPGLLTRWGLLATRVAFDVSAMATVGVLTVAVLMLPRAGQALGPDAARLVRLSARWAVVWVVAAVLGALLGLSNALGMPVWTVLGPDLLPLALELPHTRALLSTAWLAALVVVWSRWTRSPAGGWLLLLTSGAALLPTLLNAHAAHEDAHSLGVTSLVVHVGAASVWLGGLLALAVHLRRSTSSLAATLPRYSRAALACFALVALTGVLTGSTALDRVEQLWTTPYGQLLLAKAAALGALGLMGHLHRRRTVRAVAAGRPRAFLVLAAVELVLMAGAAGLAVGLSQTSPPPAEHAAVSDPSGR